MDRSSSLLSEAALKHADKRDSQYFSHLFLQNLLWITTAEMATMFRYPVFPHLQGELSQGWVLGHFIFYSGFMKSVLQRNKHLLSFLDSMRVHRSWAIHCFECEPWVGCQWGYDFHWERSRGNICVKLLKKLPTLVLWYEPWDGLFRLCFSVLKWSNRWSICWQWVVVCRFMYVYMKVYFNICEIQDVFVFHLSFFLCESRIEIT